MNRGVSGSRPGHRMAVARLLMAGVLAAGWTVLAVAGPAQAQTIVAEDPAPADPTPADAPGANSPAPDHDAGHASPDASTTAHATDDPSAHATDEASDAPSDMPTDEASDAPSDASTGEVTDAPTDEASDAPTDEPTDSPMDESEMIVNPAGLSISFDVAVGDAAAGAGITVSAESLAPDSEVSVWVFSTPRLLGTATASTDGTAAVDTSLPDDLAPGVHTVLVRAIAADGTPEEAASSVTIGPDGTIQAIEAGVDPAGLEVPGASTDAHVPAYAPVTPLDSPAFVASTSVAALTVATVVGAGIGVSAARTGTSGRGGAGGGGGGGGLDASVRKRSDEGDDTDDFGDRARPAARLGVALAGWATSVRRVSPLLSRVMLDAAPLRALVGWVSVLLPIAGIILGIAGAVSADGKAQPPALGIMIALVVIGVFDSLAGVLAVLAFSIGVIVSGGLVDLSSVRTLIGVLLVIVGPGLIGSSFRDIRRRRAMGSAAMWERLTDLVVVPLMGAWTALAIVKALPDLGGRAFPLAEHARLIGLVVLVCLVLKVLLEEAAARWAPGRMRAVTLLADVDAGAAQQAISALVRTGMFLLIAAAFVGNVWQLWIAAVLFLLPGLLSLLAHRFRNVASLWQAIPEGVPLFVLMIVIGLVATAALSVARGQTPSFAQDSFLIMAVPGFLLALLGLVGQGPREGDVRWYTRPSMTALYRVGGVVMLILAIVLAARS